MATEESFIPDDLLAEYRSAIIAGDINYANDILHQLLDFGISKNLHNRLLRAQARVSIDDFEKSLLEEEAISERAEAAADAEGREYVPVDSGQLDVAEQANIAFNPPASSAKRHTLIACWSRYWPSNIFDARTVIQISDGSQSTDLSNVVSVQDLALPNTLGSSVTPSIVQQNNQYNLIYNHTFNNLMTQTTIRVEWAGGVTKDFDVDVPGALQARNSDAPQVPIGNHLVSNDTANGCPYYMAIYGGAGLGGSAVANQADIRLGLFVKKYELDPSGAYSGAGTLGFGMENAVQIPGQLSYAYNLGYSTENPSIASTGLHMNAYIHAATNAGFPQGIDWDNFYGYNCINNSWNFGVAPNETSEQLHRAFSVIIPMQPADSNDSDPFGITNWNDYGVGLAGMGVSYDSIKTAFTVGTSSSIPAAPHGGFAGALPLFPIAGTRIGPTSVISYIEYADNLSCCAIGPTFDVCTDSSNPSYYLNTSASNYGFDCTGQPIAATYLNGTAPANFVQSPGAGCCTVDCDDFNNNAYATAFQAATYNTADGIIKIGTGQDLNNLNFGYGDPWTSGAQYLYTISHPTLSMTQTAPGAGGSTFTASCTTNTTAGTESHITIGSASDKISEGMMVSGTGIPSNSFVGHAIAGNIGSDAAGLTKFQLVDAGNSPVNATAAGTNSLTFASGFDHKWGSLAASTQPYTVCIKDDSDCEKCFDVYINEGPPPVGCTDSNAINYDSTAVQDDGTCISCDTTTGDLTGTGLSVPFLNNMTYSQVPVTNFSTSNNNGEITFSADVALQAIPALNSISSTASYTLTLYSFTNHTDSLNNTGGTQVAQQTGITLATGPNHVFTGRAAGFYGCRIEIENSATGSPPGDDAGLEICHGYIPGLIQADVCIDSSANNANTSLDSLLQNSNPLLCTFDCILTASPNVVNNAPCEPELHLDVTSTSGIPAWDPAYPNGTTLTVVWTFNGNVISGATDVTNGYTNSIVHTSMLGGAFFHTPGTYAWEITAQHPTGIVCQVTGSYTIADFDVCGCTNTHALNYNPAATVNDGSCIFPSWNCFNYTCQDPGDGTGTYTTLADCQTACVAPVGGCTDQAANNYNAGATFDDGSCIYEACLDQNAIGDTYLHNCNGVYTPNATTHNPSCCLFCSGNEPVITSTSTTDASVATGCTTNADGVFEITAYTNSALACPTWSITISNSSGAVTLPLSPVINNNATYSTGNLLSAGAYTYVVSDTCYGCSTTGTFYITADSSSCGCTDPNSPNYDSNATIDDGSCLFCGCTDPLASNYNINAVCDDGSCLYNIPVNPCSLTNSESLKILNKATECLTKRGQTYLNKLKTGLTDDCSIMNHWKLEIINYLLKTEDKQLDCLYNCVSDTTVDSDGAGTTPCSDMWVTGGPTTGANDAEHPGTSISAGEGTTITDPSLFFVPSTVLYTNDVIKMPSGLIYKVSHSSGLSGSCTDGCYDPESPQGVLSENWVLCNDLDVFTPETSSNANYLDKFINFVNKFCADCNTNFNN